MDRRYSGMRFYDGTRASDNASKKADDLVRRYMSNINRARRSAENYGGSTGGRKSLDGNTGLKVIQQRQDAQRDAREIFEKEGIGRFGARKEAYIAKQFDDELHDEMLKRQRAPYHETNTYAQKQENTF